MKMNKVIAVFLALSLSAGWTTGCGNMKNPVNPGATSVIESLAIRGLDYINEDFDGVTRRAIDWWKQGGIVSICWPWCRSRRN